MSNFNYVSSHPVDPKLHYISGHSVDPNLQGKEMKSTGPNLSSCCHGNSSASPKDGQPQRQKKRRTTLLFVSEVIVRSVERACGLWGVYVARHPVLAVLGSVLLVSFLASGLASLNLVFRSYELWVPRRSEFSQVTDWKTKNFPSLYREQIAIWESENVLSASSVKEMWKFHLEAQRLNVTVGDKIISWQDVCVKIPVDGDTTFDERSSVCYETSLLEIWGYDSSVLEVLTDANILEDLKSASESKVFGAPANISFYLGGLSKDEDGNIVRARTAIHTWFTIINEEEIEAGEYEVDIGTGRKVDLGGMTWEKALVRLATEWDGEVHINVRAGHTLGYVLHSSIANDAVWIGVGWTVLLIYVLLTLGKPSQDDQRIIPAFVGFLAIGMAVLSSYGACSMMGIPFGTLNNVLPVLLVALGVDDMYVIVTAWDGFRHIGDVERRAQLAMTKAGMAITVTSVTDILAFLVGTTTALPGLRWFCIYSSVGITMVYFLQGTLFVTAVVVNQRWMNSKKRKKKTRCDVRSFPKWKSKVTVKGCMDMWGRCIMHRTTKGVVFAITSAMLIYSIVNINFLGREFDTIWLIPESSSLYKWYHKIESTFPQKNEVGVVLFKGPKFPDDLSELKELSRNLSSLPEVFDVEAWFNDVDLEQLFEEHTWLKDLSPREQCKNLLQYLGIAKQRHFRIDFDLEDYEIYDDEGELETFEEHPCSTFQIEFQYLPPKTHDLKQASMRRIRKLVEDAQISGYKAAWAHVYSQWETDRIILEDLFKSLCIVLSVVWVISLILLASWRAALLVLLCVIASLMNVASCIYLWDLTINTVTGIALVLAIGICVDYSAHIAHNFLSATGTKEERAASALHYMGSAVFHGGTSTCLTFILLSPSDNYIFVSYFKILTSVSFFGLYHALVLLPVLLSLFGPDPHPRDGTVTSTGPSSDVEHNPQNKDGPTVYVIDIPPSTPCFKPPQLLSLNYSPITDSPTYLLSHTACPPLYRKSSSLPSLALFLSDGEMTDSTRSTDVSSSSSSQKSFRHSTCCTKL